MTITTHSHKAWTNKGGHVIGAHSQDGIRFWPAGDRLQLMRLGNLPNPANRVGAINGHLPEGVDTRCKGGVDDLAETLGHTCDGASGQAPVRSRHVSAKRPRQTRPTVPKQDTPEDDGWLSGQTRPAGLT